MSGRANFANIYLRGMHDRSMRSRTEFAQEIHLTAWCCSTKLYGEELQASGLQAFSRSKTFQVHRLLDPERCLDDLLYLTALEAFVLSPTPRGNKDLILNDVVILSVLSYIALETWLKRRSSSWLELVSVKFTDFDEKNGLGGCSGNLFMIIISESCCGRQRASLKTVIHSRVCFIATYVSV